MSFFFGNNNDSSNIDYITPKQVWVDIIDFLPKDETLWEPFYVNGQSGNDLRSLGYTVYHANEEFLHQEEPRGSIIVGKPTNKEKSKKLLEKIKEMDIPFILLLPASKLITNYVRKLFGNKLQIMVPKKRIDFIKVENGIIVSNDIVNPFDTFYYCYKMNIPSDLIFLGYPPFDSNVVESKTDGELNEEAKSLIAGNQSYSRYHELRRKRTRLIPTIQLRNNRYMTMNEWRFCVAKIANREYIDINEKE